MSLHAAMRSPGILALAWLACTWGARAASLWVDAGPHARSETPVSFGVPGKGPWELVTATGVVLPVQVDGDGLGWFVLPGLESGASAKLELRRGKRAVVNHVDALALPGTGGVRVEVRDRPVFTYRTTPTELPGGRPDLSPVFRRGGYIHPVLTPSGRVVTDDYPVNHRHHHGIWFAWTRVDFEGRRTDFWNMGDRKGTVEFVALDESWGGPVHGGFRSRHRQVDLTSGAPRVAMEETWTVRAFDVGARAGFRLFELVVTNTCAGNVPVSLPKYRYGGIGVRGHARWNDAAQMGFLNSEGTTDRSKGDNAATVGRWAAMHGPLEDGQAGGLAVLGHPGNVHAPQPQRIHPTEPFLCLAPQQAGDMALVPGKPLVSRYRFVTFDGMPEAAWMERLWRDYAEPPTTRIMER